MKKVKNFIFAIMLLGFALGMSSTVASCGATGAIQGQYCLKDYLDFFLSSKNAAFVSTVIDKTAEYLELGYGSDVCLKVKLDAEQLGKFNFHDIVTLTKRGNTTLVESNQNAGLDTEPVSFEINSKQISQ